MMKENFKTYDYLYYKELNNNLKNKIAILDSNNCSLRQTSFTIYDDILSPINESFSIIGENKRFVGNFKNLNITLKAQYSTPFFYLQNYLLQDIKNIYNNENRSEPIAEIKPNGLGSYIIKFKNLAKGETEYIEMISDRSLHICDIFYINKGNKKDSSVICKIIRNGECCDIHIASGIDYKFILGIASFFFYRDIYINVNEKIDFLSGDYNDNTTDIDTDNNISFTTPLVSNDVLKVQFNKNNYFDTKSQSLNKYKNKCKNNQRNINKFNFMDCMNGFYCGLLK